MPRKVILAISPIGNYLLNNLLRKKLGSELYDSLEIVTIPPPPTQKELISYLGVEGGPVTETPFFYASTRTKEEILPQMEDCEVLVVYHFPVTAEIMDASTKLKIIGCPRGGPVNIDLLAAEKRDIRVTNAPAHNAIPVADHVFALLFAEVKNVVRGFQLMKDDKWQQKYLLESSELEGKTIGIVGFGSVGRLIPPRATGFNMRILIFDPYVSEEEIATAGGKKVEFETLLKESDFITIHIRLTEDTVNMFSKEQFELMKPSAFLINTSRGPAIDEDALYWALKNNKIAGAGLDVFNEEPMSPHNPLLTLDNITLTPHTAYMGTNYLRGCEMVIDDIVRYLNSEPMKRVVKAEPFLKERDLYEKIFKGRKIS
jgi:D-3-phosphoglycerate dehydrogenase